MRLGRSIDLAGQLDLYDSTSAAERAMLDRTVLELKLVGLNGSLRWRFSIERTNHIRSISRLIRLIWESSSLVPICQMRSKRPIQDVFIRIRNAGCPKVRLSFTEKVFCLKKFKEERNYWRQSFSPALLWPVSEAVSACFFPGSKAYSSWNFD